MLLYVSHCYLHKFLSSSISPLLNNQIPVSSLCSKVQGKFSRNSWSGLLFFFVILFFFATEPPKAGIMF